MSKHLVCVAAILGMAVSTATAQVKIIESKPIGRTQTSASSPPRQSPAPDAAASAAQTELYYQMQMLQEEVQNLRGLVEQQTHEIKRLQQQRLEDYLDLDRRIGQLGSKPSRTSESKAVSVPTTSAAQIDEPAPDGELDSYRAAIDLVLKQRDFDGGVKALQSHLKAFPRGHYVANAQYWLGQIHLQKNELQQSKDWFALMIKEHPNHQKAPEAKFKLGKVYHLLGETDKAKKILREVANANVAVASLAEDYLKQNF